MDFLFIASLYSTHAVKYDSMIQPNIYNAMYEHPELLTFYSTRSVNVMIFVGLSTTDSVNNERQLSKAN